MTVGMKWRQQQKKPTNQQLTFSFSVSALTLINYQCKATGMPNSLHGNGYGSEKLCGSSSSLSFDCFTTTKTPSACQKQTQPILEKDWTLISC